VAAVRSELEGLRSVPPTPRITVRLARFYILH
jgi:hypothetical protein